VATKLIPWLGKHITMAGRSTLVKAVLSSFAIYFYHRAWDTGERAHED
jgi:uncharacterized membrane protein